MRSPESSPYLSKETAKCLHLSKFHNDLIALTGRGKMEESSHFSGHKTIAEKLLHASVSNVVWLVVGCIVYMTDCLVVLLCRTVSIDTTA